MQSYPFTSQVTYDEQGLPLYDRAVDSAFLRKVFAQYFSDGIFYKPTNALQVVADTGMQVAVEPGVCHIQGAMGIETSRRTLVVQAAESLDRIDTVVARLDLSVAVRSIDLYVLKGTAASSPQAPALTRDSTTWELGLANLFVAKNTASISQQRITDTRLDTPRCGVVIQTIGDVDTAPYFAQLTAAIAQHQEEAGDQIAALKAAIEAVEGDAAWMMKDLYDPQDLREDLGIQLYTHSKSGTVHNFVGTGMNGRAKITAAFNDGDTVQLNGTPVTATCGADPVDGDAIVNGRWVSFVADAEGGQINFKGGGGLGNTKLAQATAEPSDVISGETFYAGDKGLKTGTIVDHTGTTNANSVRSSGGNFYAAIPYGAYRQNSGNGYPEIKFTHTLSVKDQLTSSDDTNTTSKTFTLKNAIPFGFLCISSARNIADGRTIKITSVTSASGTCTKIYSSLVFGYSDNGAFVGVWMLKNIPANTKITIKGDGFAYSFNAATFTVK